MRRFWKLTLIGSMIFMPLMSYSVVDMKNSNYAESMIDLTSSGTGYALKVQRYYNSRSVFNGIFGFGWCSDFETTIEKMPEGRLKLSECGAGQEVIYSPNQYSNADLDGAIDQIIAYYKKSTRGATGEAVDTLKTQLREYPDLRARWAKEAGIQSDGEKKGTVYSADNIEVEKIVFDGKEFIRNLPDGTSQRFDGNGRLITLYDKNGNYLKLVYGGDHLKEVVDTKGKKLTFKFSGRRVVDVSGPSGLQAKYKYKGEDLVQVTNAWGNTYGFEYSETHNLNKIQYPDKTSKIITYNEKNDWVTSFKDRVTNKKRPACVESYNYEIDKGDPKNHYWSTAKKVCGKDVVNEARFEFWYRVKKDGQKYLHRVLTKSKRNSLDVTYHSEFGRPITVNKNGTLTAFSYYANGLVQEKSTSALKLKFEYKNSFNKVSDVEASFIDASGNLLRKRNTKFDYDGKGNLVFAKNSDGQSVLLTYDASGRIATIVDQAKKEVQIKYDERTGKPHSITRPKVGTLVFTYKPNGEVDQPKSTDDDPTVAVQIASTFNNFLDIIAPATSELNL